MQTPDGCRSLFALKGKASTAQQVAADLGVDYVLDSSVRRRDGSLRISAQLVDARSGFQRWAERYDRPAVEAFAVQAEVTSRRIRELMASERQHDRGRGSQSLGDALARRAWVLRQASTDRFADPARIGVPSVGYDHAAVSAHSLQARAATARRLTT
jgi:hypothetical protein